MLENLKKYKIVAAIISLFVLLSQSFKMLSNFLQLLLIVILVMLCSQLLCQVNISNSLGNQLDYKFRIAMQIDSIAYNYYRQNINYDNMLNLRDSSLYYTRQINSIYREQLLKYNEENSNLYNENAILKRKSEESLATLDELHKKIEAQNQKIFKLRASRDNSIIANIGFGGIILAGVIFAFSN